MSTKKLFILSILFNILLILLLCIKTNIFKTKGPETSADTELQRGIERRNATGYYFKKSTLYADKKSIFEMLSKNTNDTNQIIFLGDSHIEMCNWNECFKNKNIINRGIGGDNTEGILNRLDIITAAHPNKIFLEIGTCDIYYGFAVAEIIANYKTILSSIKTKSPHTKIYIMNCPPNLAFEKVPNKIVNQLNTELKQTSAHYNATYIDIHTLLTDESSNLRKQFTSDNIHLNGEGYSIWKTAIENFVDE